MLEIVRMLAMMMFTKTMIAMMMMAMKMMAMSVGGVRWRDRLIPRDEKSCSERRFENGFYTTTTRFYFYFYFYLYFLHDYYPF